MKKFLLLALALVALMPTGLRADEPVKPWKYVDAEDLRVINRGWATSELDGDYTRMPAILKDSIRTSLWDRSRCSAGIAVRFATNSTRIAVKYELLLNTHMIHMADTGLKGVDLYIFEGDSVWRHANTVRPYLKKEADKTPEEKDKFIVESELLSNLDGEMHEYMMYMPLYDGVKEFLVKVDEDAIIHTGNHSFIDEDRKIVAYGTSIMQGGCASRTGMASSNIISRELNTEVVNLGYSGDGKMDFCLARAIAAIDDVDLYLLDPVPNCTEMMCDTLTYDFVKIIADAHPETPIVMVAGPLYPYSRYDSFFGKYLPAKNDAFRRNYQRLKDEGYNVYFIESDGMDGVENDGTVDGIHLTDLGFRHYADLVSPKLKAILGW